MSTASPIDQRLLTWYRNNRRPLPWRRTKAPYSIWLSEVILQQTRVDQGTAYWERFIERYPTVQDLSKASEDEVLKLWQGLGYYSRARNLRKAAIQVVEEHDGRFPETMAGLQGLKGVGEYTAAAIGSICFDLVEPVVDGNVYRVLARFYGIEVPIDKAEGRKLFKERATRIMDQRHPGDHNQAMMELGATVCTPRLPSCGTCPLRSDCVAHATGRIADLPVKVGKTRIRTRHFNYLHIRNDQGIYLQKRVAKDIWQELYELPLIESDRAIGEGKLLAELRKLISGQVRIIARSNRIKHLLSHQHIRTVFWQIEGVKDERAPGHWIPADPAELGSYAMPRPIERYLEDVVRTDRP